MGSDIIITARGQKDVFKHMRGDNWVLRPGRFRAGYVITIGDFLISRGVL